MGRDAGAPNGQDPTAAQPQDGNPSAGDGDSGAGGQAPPAGGNQQQPVDHAGELSKVRREAGDWRTKFRSADEAREAAETTLKTEQTKASTLERENLQLKTELQDFKLGSSVSEVAAKLGFHSPELAVRVIDKAALKFDDKTGNPTNVEELLQTVLETHPYLAKSNPDFGGGNRGTTPASGPSMTELIRAASGR